MKLYAIATSPYVRKVMVLAHETGLVDRIEIVKPNLSLTTSDPDLNRANPIGKVPALVLDDGGSLYDSPVICEYLDSLHDGPQCFPPAGPERWHALQRQALGDGMLDAAVIDYLGLWNWDGTLDRIHHALYLKCRGSLYDSPVICEYLDSLHDGPQCFPPAGPERWHALQRQALGDGMLDAAVTARLEVAARPAELQWADYVTAQLAKVRRGLDALEADCLYFPTGLDIGGIAIACALAYLDLRYAEEEWRIGHPSLAVWFDPIAERPSMVATTPPT